MTPPAAAPTSAGPPALRAEEVSRHAVRLVVVDRAADRVAVAPFATLPARLRTGDVVIVNDAATLPASLRGETAAGEPFELRLAAPLDGEGLAGVVFGPGDHRTRTEHRAPPPRLAPGDRVLLGTFTGRVTAVIGRRIALVADEQGDALWQALYASGAPVQYAHRSAVLPLWAVQTPYATRPWAAEMPSAGRPLTWDVLLAMRRAGVALARVTHAAGLSSTGDPALDRALPWPERYEIPRRTVDAIAVARAAGGRVIAVGTTVVRALEAAAASAVARGPTRTAPREIARARHAAEAPLVPGAGVARLRIDASHRLRVVDGLLTGLHLPGESHFDLLTAFAPRDRLARALALAAVNGLSGHELGDACLIA